MRWSMTCSVWGPLTTMIALWESTQSFSAVWAGSLQEVSNDREAAPDFGGFSVL
ncbi:hypothetical protein I380019A4_11890 [Sutterella wadsworthensis]